MSIFCLIPFQPSSPLSFFGFTLIAWLSFLPPAFNSLLLPVAAVIPARLPFIFLPLASFIVFPSRFQPIFTSVVFLFQLIFLLFKPTSAVLLATFPSSTFQHLSFLPPYALVPVCRLTSQLLGCSATLPLHLFSLAFTLSDQLTLVL